MKQIYLWGTLDFLTQHDKERFKEIWESSEQLIKTTEENKVPYLRIKQENEIHIN